MPKLLLPTFAEETKLWNRGLTVVGMDEAGRGPWAGPVVVGAVVFAPDTDPNELLGLKDSKQMTALKRELWFEKILTLAQSFAIASASAAEIDALNILQATKLAMLRALEQLSFDADKHFVLTDAVRFQATNAAFGKFEQNAAVQGVVKAHQPFIHGESVSLSIAAGAILAKVTRDKLMKEMDQKYPEYGFGQHKGYGTVQHLAALQKCGTCPEHRFSFAPVKKITSP